MHPPVVSRRRVLAGLAAAGGMALAGGTPWRALAGQTPQEAGAKRRRSLRLAHLTDFHIQPELSGMQGVAACLRHVQARMDRPELIVTGGDLIMDSFDQGHARTKLLWDVWTSTLKYECSLPIEHCLGNHDIWGWNKSRSGTSGHEPGWGKKWALDALGMARPYHSFERAGWRIVVLDSVQPDGEGYMGRLDDEQFAWLENVLQGAGRAARVLVVSHIPILSVTGLASQKQPTMARMDLSPGLSHTDATRLVGLFEKHGNVRACLSGHMHELERVEYRGVTYLCDGAVSGGWWKGPHRGCPEGYALIDLYDDGTVEREYVKYGWVAKKD